MHIWFTFVQYCPILTSWFVWCINDINCFYGSNNKYTIASLHLSTVTPNCNCNYTALYCSCWFYQEMWNWTQVLVCSELITRSLVGRSDFLCVCVYERDVVFIWWCESEGVKLGQRKKNTRTEKHKDRKSRGQKNTSIAVQYRVDT